MKTKSILYRSVFALLLSAVAARAEEIKTVLITANDLMRFNVKRIDAEPGQKIRVQLKNEGTLPREVMAHNWILLKAGSDTNAYTETAASARNQNYRPASLDNEVIAAIPLVGANETGEVVFNAPSARGVYPFLCSYPGHCQTGMRGELVVR